ncbi:MAG: THUMP domain-containing protein, partial [Coriobacteriales bacterium]|nr:THUMP domain-containing protein [Coriobacteriales bacterium]
MTRYTCLVHYHELGLKGRNRSTFEQQLRRNVAAAVAPLVPQAEVARISGRLLVSVGSFDESVEVARVVTLVPGVARVSCALRTNRDLDEIQAAALEVLGMYGHYESFKVVARRANTDFYLDSMEMNRRIGAFLCEQLPDKRVRMTDVDAKVHVEVIEGSAFVYVRTERGVGGLPVGSSGKVVCL